MKPADVCIAIMVAVIWGLAFVASRMALDELPPELMTALRFAIAALPCLFVRKPKVSWSLLIAISLNLFLGQFLAQSIAIAHGVPVGLTSVIVQSQALFTIAFAAVLFGEPPTRMQTVGIGVATVGLLMICGTVGYDFSVGAFAVLMISPICFAVGNLLLRPAQRARMFDLFAWLCLCAAIPLFALRCNRWAAGDLAGVVADVTDRHRLHAFHRRRFDLHRLLAMGPAVAGLHRGAGGAVRAAGAVRRLSGVERRIRRTFRAAAAVRHGHRRLRHRHHAAGEAVAKLAETGFIETHTAQDRLSVPCRSRF